MNKLTDPEFIWIPPIRTDVMKTWKRFGFIPPSEIVIDNKRTVTVPLQQGGKKK